MFHYADKTSAFLFVCLFVFKNLTWKFLQVGFSKSRHSPKPRHCFPERKSGLQGMHEGFIILVKERGKKQD